MELHKLLRKLHIPTWEHGDISPVDLRVQKVAGALTNAVFFVSYPPIPEIRTVLLRIYGPSSGSLISRPRELHTLHVLSSQYQIGPRVYGTFDNGRVEEHFESSTLTAADLRDPLISEWIGARMAELHSVDVEAIEETSPETRGEGKGWEIGAKKNVKSWLVPAAEVLELPGVTTETLEELDLDTFKEEWSRYMQWLSHVDDTGNGSRRVFAHNDTQYGNLLRVTKAPEVIDGHQHRQVCMLPLLEATIDLPDVCLIDSCRRLRIRFPEPCVFRHRKSFPRVDSQLPLFHPPYPRPYTVPDVRRAVQLLSVLYTAHATLNGDTTI